MDVPVSIPSTSTQSSADSKSAPVSPSQQPRQQPRIVDMPVKNQNDALNILIAFLSMAQKRGAFTIQESAKLWECVKMFSDPSATQSQGAEPPIPPVAGDGSA